MGCELLTFHKGKLTAKEQRNLQSFSDFDTLIAILNNEKNTSLKETSNVYMVLSLMFPNCEVEIAETDIQLKQTLDNETITHSINNDNFKMFKELLVKIFCLNSNKKDDYVAGNSKAQELIDKFKKSKQKIAKQKNAKDELDILGRYVSILSVGLQKDMNKLLDYTVYQLYDEFDRFISKQQYDMYISAKLAGAKDAKEPDNWMRSLRQDVKKKNELKTIEAN